MSVRRLIARQTGLLRSAEAFRLLFWSTIVSGLGTWLAVVALTIDVFDRTGSGVWVSALLIADFLPAVAIGLLLGPVVDRLPRKWLIVIADVTRMGVFALLPLTDSPREIVVLAFVAGVATGFARPATYAALPNLVPAEDLARANSLLRSTEYMTTMFGTLLGGLIAATTSPDVAYVVNAVSFGLSAILLLGIDSALMQQGIAVSRGYFRDIGDGFAAVRRSAALIAVLVSWNLVMLSNASINVAEVVLAKVSLDAGDFGFGLLWAASGAGIAAGSLSAASWLERRSMTVVYTSALLLMAFGAGAAAISPSVWVAVWCMALSGTGNGVAIVCNSLLVQRGAPDHLRGRVFTLIMGSNFGVLGAGMVLAGPLTDAVGARWVFGFASLCAAAGAVAAWILLRRMRDEAAPAPAAA